MNDEIAPPLVKVWVAVLGALTLSLTDILQICQIAALVIATAYTLWKWIRDAKRKNEEGEE